MIRQPFTQMDSLPHLILQGGSEFLGGSIYFAMPQPQPPASRPAQAPPITAPGKGRWGWRKAALPPQASPAWFATAGGLTFGPGGGPGQGVIQSAQPIASVR